MYRPQDAEHTVLHQVIALHLEAFLEAVAEAGGGAGLPQFVEGESREFLLCGVFEAGVARFQCEGCAREHLVPFGIDVLACPTCGDRLRLTATLHDPAVIRTILAHVGGRPLRGEPRPRPTGARRRGALIGSVRKRGGHHEVPSALLPPVRWPVHGGGASGVACRSPGPPLSTCEETAHVRRGGGRCLSMGDYVRGMGATRGAPAAGGC